MMLWRGWSLWCGWGAWKHEGGGPAPPLPRSQTNNRTLQNFAEKRKILQNVGWRQMAAQPRSAHTIKRYTPFTFNESGFRLTGSRSDPRQKKKWIRTRSSVKTLIRIKASRKIRIRQKIWFGSNLKKTVLLIGPDPDPKFWCQPSAVAYTLALQ